MTPYVVMVHDPSGTWHDLNGTIDATSAAQAVQKAATKDPKASVFRAIPARSAIRLSVTTETVTRVSRVET